MDKLIIVRFYQALIKGHFHRITAKGIDFSKNIYKYTTG